MSDLTMINIIPTEMMKSTVAGMPQETVEMYLSSLLDMACIMVQCGDIETTVISEDQIKFTAQAKSGVRNLTVNLVTKQ